MARLHEYQGKKLLAAHGIAVPRGGVARSADEAAAVAGTLAGPAVVKVQAWTTGRASIGGIAVADTTEEAAEHAKRMLGMRVGNFQVHEVLVEEKLQLAHELFVSMFIDDHLRGPAMLISTSGGSGIEQRAGKVHRIECDVKRGPDAQAVESALSASGLDSQTRGMIADLALKVFTLARAIEARSVELNPLAVTGDGRVVALDCRMTVDDYAVFRHPELAIEIARELDHPPTELERIAYAVEQEDHRGTFYFAQLATAPAAGSRGLIGFHGAGGGGSMMSMDAITNENFSIANFTDTSGNPSAAKVYRAARIILAQPGIIGYFGSGSGVASQEQFWSAYGLAKAFWEMALSIPAVIRLGGNSEERAVEILQTSCKGLPTVVEGYTKDDPPAKIAARFAELIAQLKPKPWSPREKRRPAFVENATTRFAIKGGNVFIDDARWNQAKALVLSHASGLLRDASGKPALTITETEAAGKDSEWIACEVECRRAGIEAVFVDLDIPGLGELNRGDTGR